MAERHVKSGNSSVPVSRSKSELERILRRYGCDQFGVSENYREGTASIHFRVSDDPSQEPSVPVRLDINVTRVEEALLDAGYRLNNGQAERVAWRNLVLWVDSACSAAAVGLRPMSETFFADLVVTGQDGTLQRVFDVVGPEVRTRLLTAGNDTKRLTGR